MASNSRLFLSLMTCVLFVASLLGGSSEAWARKQASKQKQHRSQSISKAQKKKTKIAKSTKSKSKRAIASVEKKKSKDKKHKVAQAPKRDKNFKKKILTKYPSRPVTQVASRPENVPSTLPEKYQPQEPVDNFPTPVFIDTNRDVASNQSGSQEAAASSASGSGFNDASPESEKGW